MVIVKRPDDATPGTPAGDARAAVVTGLSLRAAARTAEAQIDPDAYLMSDEATAFMALGENYAKHDTVKHSSREYVRDAVHVNSVGRARLFGKPEMAGTHENPVVARATGAAIAANLSRRHRPLSLADTGPTGKGTPYF